MATSSKADISGTKNFFFIFFTFLKSTLDFQYFEKKDQSQSLSITKILSCETVSYLNVQKAIFHATLRKTTSSGVPNTAEISMEPVSYHSSINFR